MYVDKHNHQAEPLNLWKAGTNNYAKNFDKPQV